MADTVIKVGSVRHQISTDQTAHEVAMAPILGKPIKSSFTQNEYTFDPNKIDSIEIKDAPKGFA